VVGGGAYLERRGAPKAPNELADHEIVAYVRAASGDETWQFRKRDATASINVSGRIRVSAFEGVRAAVVAGLGLARGNEWSFAPELASGAVRPVLTDWTLPPAHLWAVCPKGPLASAKARAFAEFIEAEMGDAYPS
jgi:DNA-binding transcriptional LysR family regulator